MTSYPKLSAADVKQWDDDYKQLRGQLAQEQDLQQKEKLEGELQALAVKIEERLTKDIQAVRRYSKTRHHNVDSFVNEAQAELKLAKDKAAEFKKKPGKAGLPPQVKDSIEKITDIEKAFQADGLAYGDAWFDYRGSPVREAPEKYIRTFKTIQGQLVEDDKVLGMALQKIVAAQHQAEALLAITDKAAMKAGIKAGTGAQRPIEDAQIAAKELAAQMASLLLLLRDPADMSTPPRGITSGKESLIGVARDPKYLQQPNAMKAARSVWFNVQLTRKLMLAKVANMEKVLATKSKGFRSSELADPAVKLELKKAAQSVKDANKDIKALDADYAAAKKAIDELEAQAKKLKIK